MTALLAHGIVRVRDLPVPMWLFLYGGAVVLVVSFVALAALWSRPRLERASERPLPDPLQRVLLSQPLRIAAGAVSASLLVVVVAAAFTGPPGTAENLAPTFVWVVFWLGLVPLVLLLGNVWGFLSPFRAIADGIAWAAARAGFRPATLAYPPALGRWPAALLLFAFVAFELAYGHPADPRSVGVAIYAYAMVTWLGMLVLGRRAWLEGGEAFHVYFGLLARIAPLGLGERDGVRELVVRPPLVWPNASSSQPPTRRIRAGRSRCSRPRLGCARRSRPRSGPSSTPGMRRGSPTCERSWARTSSTRPGARAPRWGASEQCSS